MKWLLGFLVGMGLLLATVIFLSQPDEAIPAKGEEVLRIATANLLFNNPSPEEATWVLAHQDIDLLVLLEWTGRNFDERMLIERGYVKSACEPDRGTHGLCVFQHPEITLDVSIEKAPIDGPCNMPFATIRVLGEQPIGIKAIHPPPPLQACGKTNLGVLNYHASTIQDGRISTEIGVLQPQDAAIVMGDFNALAHWPRVRQFFDVGLVDAFSTSPAKLAPTWAPALSIPDVARIDYVWTSSELQLIDAWTLDVPGADHRALVVDIGL